MSEASDQPVTLPPSRSAALGGVGTIFVTGAFAIVAAGAVLLLASSYGFRMEAIDWLLLFYACARVRQKSSEKYLDK